MTIITDDHYILRDHEEHADHDFAVRCDLCRLITSTSINPELHAEVTVLCNDCFSDSIGYGDTSIAWELR